MANICHPMADEEVSRYILASLGLGHGDHFTTNIVLRNHQIVKLPKFYSYLIAY